MQHQHAWASIREEYEYKFKALRLFKNLSQRAQPSICAYYWHKENETVQRHRSKEGIYSINILAGLIVPFFNVYFNKILLAGPGEIGLIFSLAQGSMIIGAVAVPYLAGRIGKVKTVSLTYLISLPFLVLLAFTTNLYLAGGAYILRMLFMNMSSPVSNSFSMEIVGSEERASVSSLTSTASCFALAAGSFVAGVLMTWGLQIMPYLAACVFYTAASVLYFKFFRQHEHAIAVAGEQPIEVETSA